MGVVVRRLGLLIGLSSCGPSAPPPLLYDAPPSSGRTAYFDALWAADYAALDPVIDDLTAEAAGGDEVSQAVLGFAHAWKLSERRRLEVPDPAVVAHADLAVASFDRAVGLLPDDPRLVGFRGSFLQAQGSIWGDDALQRRGWFDTKEAARRWPEWGLFTQAYPLVTMDTDDRLFEKGIDLLWENLDACANEKVPRTDLDWAPYSDALADADAFDRRACGNTEVVPYNVEGFFLIMGDHLAQSGDLDTARNLYQVALDHDADGAWPHRELAEGRLANLSRLPAWFSAEVDETVQGDAQEMTVFGGPVSCAVCHQGG